MEIVGIVCGLLVFCLGYVQCAPQKDLVKEIPGLLKQPAFRTYSGYLEATGTRKLHYWFVESQSKPSKDPLVLWFNGGPGCSSMEGMLHEHGPFTIQDDGLTLKYNPSSWNLIANVIYLEAPAGVGYSYSDDKNYKTGDTEVANANYAAVKHFFRLFPEYKTAEFFITGESYAGVYVPMLSAQIAIDKEINFVGLLVGNGLSSYDINDNSVMYFWYYHGLIGPDVWDRLIDECCQGREHDCDFKAGARTSYKCRTDLGSVQMKVYSEGINMYNILSPCAGGVTLGAMATPKLLTSTQGHKVIVHHDLGNLFRENSMLHPDRPHLFNARRNGNVTVKLAPPCTNDTALEKYMNLQAVKNALHIAPHLPAWTLCSDEVSFSYSREFQTMVNFYKLLLASPRKLRIVLYNGDIDMACNFLGDQWFVDDLKAKLLVKRRSWLVKDVHGYNQIAGFVKEFQGISFMTVKGAGHMVPTDKPVQALQMFKRFIQNLPF